MKKAVVYARYSSERQNEQSIEGQIRVCQEYAKRNNIVILDTYIDRAMTGTNDNRAAFQKMLRDSANKEWNYVLVYKLDRFSRSKYETAIHKKTLKDNGIKLLSVTENIPDTPEGIILESLLEGMAEYYSAELSQKVKRGLNESRMKGHFQGGYLLVGYKKVDKRIYVDEDEAKVIQFIFEQYARGTFVKDISSQLAARGILYKGKPYNYTTIYAMLRNEKYTGVCRYNGVEYTNIYPQIISKELFDLVRAKIEDNKYGKHISDDVYLLKNRIICGYCGKPMTSESGTARNGEIKRYYKCRGRKFGRQCNKQNIRKSVLEKIVLDTTVTILNTPETLSLLADKIMEVYDAYAEDDSMLKLLQKELSETEKTLKNLLAAIEQGIVTQTTKERLIELESTKEELERKIVEENSRIMYMPTKEEIVHHIRSALKESPQLLIRLLIHHIVVYDDKIEIYYNFVNEQRPEGSDQQVFSFARTEASGTTEIELPNTTRVKVVPYTFTIELFACV